MWFEFILISLTMSAISGSETCRGPYELPKLLEVTTTPVYKERNHILEAADVSLVVRSGSPIHTRWWYLGPPRAKEASEDDEDLRSSDEVNGDRHIFKLHVKLEEAEEAGIKNVTEILDLIHISLQVMYDCNTVMVPLRLNECIGLVRADAQFPSITLLPRAQYITDSSNPRLLKMTLSNGKEPAPDVDTDCSGYIVRKDGIMRMLSYNDENPIQSRSEKSVYLSATETTCEIDVEEDLESFYVQMHQRIRLNLTRQDGREVYHMILLTVTDFRRSGITTPAVNVRGRDERVIEREGDGKVILTSKNATNIVCMAEAANKPYIALAKLTIGGNYQILSAKTGYSQFHVSLNLAHYSVLSPSLLKKEEYICSAASGQEVTSQRFKILRYDAVHVKSMTEGGDAVYMEAVGNQQYNLTCEATGVPQPEVKFYWTPKPTYGEQDVKGFQEINKDHEIHDSDVIGTTTRVEGTKTYGTIIIKDVKKIIADLSDSFWQDNYSYDIVCLGYNEYSYTSTILGHSEKPYDWGLTNTTMQL